MEALNAPRSMKSAFFFLGGSRGRKNTATTDRDTRLISASALAVHANSATGINRLTTTSCTISPTEFP